MEAPDSAGCFHFKNNTIMKSFLFSIAILFLVFGCKQSDADSANNQKDVSMEIPALKPRTGALAKATEWAKTQEKVQELNANIARNQSDIKSRLQIATIYLAEARITGEHPYYYPAADQIIDGALYLDPQNFDALVLKASVKLSQHQFAEARALAEKARAVNPANAYVYGILVDANVEMGNYQEAVANSDKMQELKPSLESYARASYLREIFGDLPGAIEAMRLAVDAGLPGSEPQCWSRNTLADLYIKSGDLKKAENEYKINLEMRPSYAFSIAGLAKIESKKKNHKEALALLDKAAGILPEFSFHEDMADIYVEQGYADKAMHKYEEVIEMLREDEASGHRVGLEYANLYLKMNDLKKAEKFAMEEYKTRAANIDVNQVLAWIAFKKADTQKSRAYMQVATRTGSRDPQLVERASAIARM